MPVAALPLTVSVSVELPPAVTEAGAKAPVTPLGRPLIVRATDSAEPETTAVLIVLVPAAPWATGTAAGLALIEKSFGTLPAGANALVPAGVPSPVGPS